MKTENKKDIRSLSLEDLRRFFTENQDQAFRGNQVYQWLWQKGIHNFDSMKYSRNSVTSIEVAKLAGVSQSSVSRAFSHEGPVSVKTRRKVLDAARKLGYQPNAMARSLITRRTSMVGMVIANVHNNPFYTEVLDLLSRKFQKLGQKVMLFIVNRDQNLDDILPQLLEYQVEGILVTAATLSSTMAEECERWGRPVAMINRYVPGVHASWFCCANYEGGKMVAKLLLDANHQRPAFLAGSEDTTTSIDRERGFMEILNQEKVEALREIGEYTYQDAYDAAIRLLDRKDPPDAIFCANDIMALGVMDAAKNGLGLKIPEEVSIIGFDDIPMSSWSSYSLTTVRQPIQRMVDASVEELLNRIENPEREPLQEVIPGELVIRGSARMPGGLSSGWVISQDR